MASPFKMPKISDSNGKTEKNKSLHEAIEKIDEIQNEIDRLNEKASEEILEVEQKFNKKRQPFYHKRAELISTIANFWLMALKNHPQISAYITPEDEDVLQHLTDVNIEEFDDIKSGFKMTLTFSPNKYFKNASITKSFHVGEPESRAVCEPVEWLPGGAKFTEKLEAERHTAGRKRGHGAGGGPVSFIQWFVTTCASTVDEIGEVIKDDVWPNPLQYYLASEVSDDDDDELDEDDFGAEEEDEGADEEEEGVDEATGE